MPAVPLAAPAVQAAQAEPGKPPVPQEIPIALMVDLASGQTLYSREEDRRFVPASVTKVMTAYTAFGLIEEGKLDPQTEVEISRELADEWSGEGSTMFLQAGDKVTVGQLLLGVTTVSANDASVAIALESLGSLEGWLALMNENAAELGMRNTYFGTPNGWPDEGRTFTTARDLALLAEALTTRYPDLYRRYFGHRGMRYGGYAQNNHDPVTGVVAGADGIKTGYTRQAGYNFLGSAERDGRRLVMVVAGAPAARLRDQAARDFLRWGFGAFDTQEILPAGFQIGEARVQDGAQAGVILRTENRVLASMPQGETPEVELSIRYHGPLRAPIAAGERVGWLRVSVAGQQPHDVPLIAGEEVAKANFLQRIRNGVTGLFS